MCSSDLFYVSQSRYKYYEWVKNEKEEWIKLDEIKDYKINYNYHAHIVMLNYDFSKHRTVRNNLKELSRMQTLVANDLGMAGIGEGEVKTITLGSLFDGIGGFPLAASRCGIKTLWASEIEPFPIKVQNAKDYKVSRTVGLIFPVRQKQHKKNWSFGEMFG